jgi:hypothetical protein
MGKELIVVIGDLHIKNKEPWMSAVDGFFSWLRMWDEQQSENNVTYVFTGDIIDEHTPPGQVHSILASTFFTGRLQNANHVYIIQGNHDIGRHTSGIEYLNVSDNVTVVKTLQEIEVNQVKILCLPYFYKTSTDQPNMRELYENLPKEYNKTYDLIIGHIADETDGCFGTGIDLSKNDKLSGKRVLGHIHHSESDNFIGVPIITRYNERDHEPVIQVYDASDLSKSFVDVPKFIQYETITYGDPVPCSQKHINEEFTQHIIYDIEDAPSRDAAYNKYSEIYIREVEVKPSKEDQEIRELVEADNLSVQEYFKQFVDTNKVNKEVEAKLMEVL